MAADLWTLTAPMLALMPVGMHPDFPTPAMTNTRTAMRYQMIDGMTGTCASCQPEAAPECPGLTEEAPDWPGLRETLWVSAEVGPTHSAGMTVGTTVGGIVGTTSCLLGRSHATMLLRLLMSLHLPHPDLTEMDCTRGPGTTGVLDLALYPGVEQPQFCVQYGMLLCTRACIHALAGQHKPGPQHVCPMSNMIFGLATANLDSAAL